MCIRDSSREIVALLRQLVEEHGVACGFVTHDRSLINDDDKVFDMDTRQFTPAFV